ncbi:MAG: DUF4468 domain-containing protein [Acinetobacter sp.]|uniref:DUF4468 domain-containing protein n=1 Tax=Acinetobacter sp. TaxID=472 RepID=UPI00258C0112|nr:DUF4468 domain-containing protein [Acinetobacter sp.]MCE1272438.1 DUF4468 domain-containing protein [Acinetobacter sp.]
MRKILLTFLLFTTSAFAANEPLNEVSEVVEIPDMTQKAIYDGTKIWMAKSFKSSNAVIQYEDASTGSIIGKGNMKYPCKGTWNCLAHAESLILFTVKVDTKDNKARVTFNDLLLKVKGNVNGGVIIPGYEVPIAVAKDKEIIEAGLKDVIQRYKQDIQNQKNDSNW